MTSALRMTTGLAAMTAVSVGLSLRAAPADEFAKEIRPILEKNCFECHNPETLKGDLDLAQFDTLDKIKEMPEVWQLALERVQAFEMPPKKAGQMNFDAHGKLLRWLRNLPKPERPDCDQIASDRTANFYRGYVMSRRLNRAEYSNTIRDLTGVALPVEELLPADGGGGEGFDTSGNALFTSTIHIEKYMAAAERVLTNVLADKPGKLSPELKAARQRILTAKPGLFGRNTRAAARVVVSDFAQRAWRRPVADDEVERLLNLFDRAHERGDGFVPSVRLALQGVLISPNFLFLAEPEPAIHGVHRLGPFPLASRLSYFLWSSMPDDELFALAASGAILETNVFRQQIRRMLADSKADALGERFALQWLDMEKLGTEKRPDPGRFPEFDADLSRAMRNEVTAFFNYLLRENRPLPELIDSDYTFVNARLAQIYGIQDVRGDAMRRVSLTDRNRGGIVGMPAVHTLTSYPLRTSPVLRGHWILEALLGERVPPPPPDVPALEEAKEKAGHLTLREQLELHRAKSECAGCHDKMDPLGFGLENFDVLGRWRDKDRDQPIDAQGKLPNGDTYTGPEGLKQVLMKRKDQIARHLVRKMTGFAYGRELNKFDECVIDRTMEQLKKNDYRAHVMMEQIALSFPFQHRFYPKQD